MSRSIYKTRTRLTLVTSKNAKKGSFVNSSLEKKIGKFADIQTVDEDVTKTELNQKISTFKKDTSIVDQELSVTATGDTRCVSGKCAYRSNLLAGVVAVILSIAVDTGYMILTETLMNEKMAVILIALVLLSWLCAMVGYDKVIQAISQFKVHTSE